MFLLNLFMQIRKNASHGLRNLEWGGRNGTRLVLKLTFIPKN